MAKDTLSPEIAELKKKLEENPDSLVFAPLADNYRKSGQLDEALSICKRGLEKHPNYTSARVVLGRVFQDQGKTDEAQTEFKKVLDSDPENIQAHSLLGSLFIQKGEHQAAIEEFQKVLTLNPDDEQVQESLRQAIEKAASQQKNPKADKKETAAIEKKTGTKDSTASVTIAELYLKQGHFDKAIEVYQELLGNDPQNLMLRQKLAEVVEKQQKENSKEVSGSGLKKSEFTKPPDQKEDVLEETVETKQFGKPKKEDDSKFTSDEILQVMRRGGKDDVVVEDKKRATPNTKAPPNSGDSVIPSEPAPTASSSGSTKASAVSKDMEVIPADKVDGYKGILADLSSVEGIMRSFITDSKGALLVALGESGNNADHGKQAAAIFESTHRSVSQLNQGKINQVLVTAETGHILLVSFAKYILVVLANSRTNLGLLRLALDSAQKKLEKIL
ncbi:MAG TPA: tetratricopeptide repeat protein [bacterium]|nr:tetratricopeptide repeat protein [bacterium]